VKNKNQETDGYGRDPQIRDLRQKN